MTDDDKTLLPEISSFDVHLGIADNYADMFMAKMERLGIEVHHLEDGWEAWGTPIGWSNNDQNTLHVVLRYAHVQTAITEAIEIAQKYVDILTPMSRQTLDETRNGTVTSVTYAGNWDEKFVEINRQENRTHVARFTAQYLSLPWK